MTGRVAAQPRKAIPESVGIVSSMDLPPRQFVHPKRQHRDRLRYPGQRGQVDRQPADHLRHGHPPLPRSLLQGRRCGRGSAKRAAAVLTNVVSGTPADKAELEVCDAIIAVDGNCIDGSLSLVAQVRERTVGDTVALRVIRAGQSKDVNVTLIAKPATTQ